MKSLGLQLIGSEWTERDDARSGKPFRAFNPALGTQLEEEFYSATGEDVERAALLAREAFDETKKMTGRARGRFLRAIADGLQSSKDQLIEEANKETALPVARLESELGRTMLQMRLFAELVEEGAWVGARLDAPDIERKPTPKPDLRSMLRPLGPVVVFGASNFPFAYSVAGGDTASALAAGCPVIVKVHAAHPATSALTGEVVARAARECGMPKGIFSLLFDAGFEVGVELVSHPVVKAVGFTGSRKGGLALVEVAAKRREPIPVFAEMSSTNPVFIAAGALRARGAELVKGLHQSITNGLGQFCTNPGLVLLPVREEGDRFVRELAELMKGTEPGTMLSSGIASNYSQGLHRLEDAEGVNMLARVQTVGVLSGAALFETTAQRLLEAPELGEEVFGPSTLLVRYGSSKELRTIARALEGQLTATLQLEAEEWAEHAELAALLEEKAGRLIVNGFPTGVEVGHAIVHGGPFPATSDGRSTSVGTRAIERFMRPVCFQNFPEEALPLELQRANPLGIRRVEDGVWVERDGAPQ